MTKQSRRHFIKTGGTAVLPLVFSGAGLPLGAFHFQQANKIDSIVLYRYDVTLARHFSFGVWKNRQAAFLKITSGEHTGWGEVTAGINKPELSLAVWGEFLAPLRGMTIAEAMKFSESKYGAKGWSWSKNELIEMALYDLQGKIEGRSALEILGSSGREPVPGLFPILEQDIDKVRYAAKEAKKRQYNSHIKLKIFGKKESDGELIAAVRQIMGKRAYIVCDPNEGYKNWKHLDELAETMKYLGGRGMNACEDPANLSQQQWIDLQEKIQPLSIIPDVPMRPAWTALEEAKAGMGNVYNLHPAAMGSLKHAVRLAAKIKSWGHELMIGDASLVGPGCSVWQQLAIGMGASWVEAIEKPIESDNYLPCVQSLATYRTKYGSMAMKSKPGFGLEINEEKLGEVCSQRVKV